MNAASDAVVRGEAAEPAVVRLVKQAASCEQIDGQDRQRKRTTVCGEVMPRSIMTRAIVFLRRLRVVVV